MSEATVIAAVVAVMAALPPTIAALAAFMQSRAAVEQAKIATAVGASTAQKTDGLIGQVQQVHTLTNSNLSAVKAELAIATQQITSLLAIVQELKTERDKVAMATAYSTPVPSKDTTQEKLDRDTMTMEAKEAIENLKKIDKNTKAIEENTAATDKTVERTAQAVQTIKDNQS